MDWKYVIQNIISTGEYEGITSESISDTYEQFLADKDKQSKKDNGQYYTPDDVADVLADKFISLYSEGDNLADVCCGCGNLIIRVIRKMNPYDLIENRKIYLFDLDETALEITCLRIYDLVKNRFSFAFVKEHINSFVGDFLESQGEIIPKNTIVISNPPYVQVPKNSKYSMLYSTRDCCNLYAYFIEAITENSKGSVIIVPQSFIGSQKYSSLRKVLSNYGGFIYSFDNIPGNIFKGVKKGQFTTNVVNSTRTAFLVVDSRLTGYQITPMLRFKQEERGFLLSNIDSFLGNMKQSGVSSWVKTPKKLEPLYTKLISSNKTVIDYISEKETDYRLYIPATPRYFLSASISELERGKTIIINAKDEYSQKLLYCYLNSSVGYFWWRIRNGEIMVSKQDIESLPVFDIEDLSLISSLYLSERDYIVTKNNAGKNNENIKFPEEIRKELNSVILQSLGLSNLNKELFHIHDNHLIH